MNRCSFLFLSFLRSYKTFASEPWEGKNLIFASPCPLMKGFPGGSVVKESFADVGAIGDTSSIPGSGRSLGEGNDNPLQYSCLENPMDRGAWQAISMGLQESDTTEGLSMCTHICKTQILSEIMQKNWQLSQWGSLVLLLLPDSVINLGTATWRMSVARTIILEQGLPASFTCISFRWPHSWARVVDVAPAGEIVLRNVSVTFKVIYQYFGY